jgi:hypothetical protein
MTIEKAIKHAELVEWLKELKQLMDSLQRKNAEEK